MMIVPTQFQDPPKVEASGLNNGSKNNKNRVQNMLFVKEMCKHYFATLEKQPWSTLGYQTYCWWN